LQPGSVSLGDQYYNGGTARTLNYLRVAKFNRPFVGFSFVEPMPISLLVMPLLVEVPARYLKG
jgi:hypothetical protein